MFSLSDAGVLEAPEVCESFYDTLIQPVQVYEETASRYGIDQRNYTVKYLRVKGQDTRLESPVDTFTRQSHQSTADTRDSASGCQIHFSQFCVVPLTTMI